jgi:hypothetical protein
MIHTLLDTAKVNITFFAKEFNAATDALEIQKAVGTQTLIELTQIHTDNIIVIDSHTTANRQEADALMTDQKNIALMIKTADCQALVLYDPEHSVIANIHAGWKSLIAEIIPKTIKKMKSAYQTNPESIQVFCVPSLGVCCSEFSDPHNEIPQKWHQHITPQNHVDLMAIADEQLIMSGITSNNIQRMKDCTSCNTNTLYSHRKKDSGRMATVVYLK